MSTNVSRYYHLLCVIISRCGRLELHLHASHHQQEHTNVGWCTLYYTQHELNNNRLDVTVDLIYQSAQYQLLSMYKFSLSIWCDTADRILLFLIFFFFKCCSIECVFGLFVAIIFIFSLFYSFTSKRSGQILYIQLHTILLSVRFHRGNTNTIQCN